jgi:NAD(P)-dependent dehydrogenase (short-subunit alcohol dehydrogenase family)
MARALASSGASVAILNRRLEKAEAMANEIQQTGGKALGLSCDVLDAEALEAAKSQIEEAFGPIDILVNAAGGNHPKATTSVEQMDPIATLPEGASTFYELETEGMSSVFDLNFFSTVTACQVLTRSMAERGEGVVITISSVAAALSLTKVPAYSASKAAVENFTRWLSIHLAPCGIRVNAITPGFFLTEQNRSLLTNEDGTATARGQKILSQTPMGRLGVSNELNGALLWLVSDDASFVTGAVIDVDGGFSAFNGV